MDTELTTTLPDVRLAILRQHTQLAQLLDKLEECAEAVIANREDGAAYCVLPEMASGGIHSRGCTGGVRRNPRKFRHPKSSPARSASSSIILPPLWNV